ncbi:uncharacterized protein BJ212DRAFT_70774 [Suillus subaureus]|uniref:Uncharacterized protein n=1 Tax=Suillus subaureus TaxID=48587 RepID=A0A9P7JF36_9AGAM|nr:uncharacterized protein BJ212DRAFT_70774 [Suillus subaureus]KAG1819061.1 hypothetical protein BJ212DRAFT_70774 [Suillus subaureus]
MASLLSTDSSAPSLSSLSPDMDEVLTGVRYIMEISVAAQDTKLLDIISILTTQAEKIKERDQSIIIMQSKLDLQQTIMEEIRSEQRQLMSAVASCLESNAQHAQHASATLSPPIMLEMPEPVTPARNPERLPITISVPELPSSQATPTPAFHPSLYRNSIPVAHANLRTATTDDRWRAPKRYIKTQRGGQLRRQGAFYGTPDWSTMSELSGGVSDSGAPPSSPPASRQVQEEAISAAGNSRADVHTLVEVTQEINTAADTVKATVSNEGDRASSRNSCKRCRDPDEQEARRTANRMDISSIVHTTPDGSSPSVSFSFCSTGPSPARGGGSDRDGPPKRRRVSQDIVDSDLVSDTKRLIRRSPRRAIPR